MSRRRERGLPVTAHAFRLALVALMACRGTLSPLSNKLDIGQEAYLVFVADGEDGQGDLFASTPAGGKSFQVTFSRVDEALPALSPDGTMLAFVRTWSAGAERKQSVVVMNLLSGSERRTGVGDPTTSRVAWSSDGKLIFLRSGSGSAVTAAPPERMSLQPVSGGDTARADSALAVLLGDPPIAQAIPCDTGSGLCARLRSGAQFPISAEGRNAVRWPGDSVAYLEDGKWIVRPLAGGRTRMLGWSAEPGHPRELTIFPGPAGPADSSR